MSINGHLHTDMPRSEQEQAEETWKRQGLASQDKAPISDPAQSQKKDAGKIPIARGLVAYFPRALREIAAISAFGYEKYGSWGGWVNVPNGLFRYEDALLRHTIAMATLEDRDPESNMLHAAHRAWCALAILELLERQNEKQVKAGAPR